MHICANMKSYAENEILTSEDLLKDLGTKLFLYFAFTQ